MIWISVLDMLTLLLINKGFLLSIFVNAKQETLDKTVLIL